MCLFSIFLHSVSEWVAKIMPLFSKTNKKHTWLRPSWFRRRYTNWFTKYTNRMLLPCRIKIYICKLHKHHVFHGIPVIPCVSRHKVTSKYGHIGVRVSSATPYMVPAMIGTPRDRKSNLHMLVRVTSALSAVLVNSTWLTSFFLIGRFLLSCQRGSRNLADILISRSNMAEVNNNNASDAMEPGEVESVPQKSPPVRHKFGGRQAARKRQMAAARCFRKSGSASAASATLMTVSESERSGAGSSLTAVKTVATATEVEPDSTFEKKIKLLLSEGKGSYLHNQI